ncbi:uracil-DNA glycosylase family protein [Variovorax sp. Sphag1AA]|uniref:uracil-DNA glycosylase family protein n=1 Tax=Variovorax sp. Sphag1AA TaxID=2587027 RepID=UPI00161EC12A|nr:uracil-DNA glycosylase family protein [Variovorax sp. Sphag1AA]MBB3180611.1 DNA polymerase [Variovorax sp. Sphag1AA]
MTPRHRAMLEEMGIKLFWWPKEGAGDAQVVAAEAPAVSAEEPVETPAERTPAPVARPAAAPVVSAPAPSRAPLAPTHGATVLADAPRHLYGAEPMAKGGWLVVADMPPELDGRHGEPFASDAGRLLDNMLRALQLHSGATPVHLVRTHRGVASGQPDSPRPLGETFAESVDALAPRLVLAMGPLAAQSLLQSGDPLGKLRGRALPVALLPGSDVPVVATYHPAYLLRNPADKGRAWADLCLAAEEFASGG